MNFSDGSVAHSGDFSRECRSLYFKLYFVCDVLNLHCFQGRLERVPLTLNLDGNQKRIFATTSCLSIPWRRKPFCSMEINLFPCMKLSSGCLLGVMLHEMNHIRDYQYTRSTKHDRRFYERMLRVGYDDKSMSYQEDTPFSRCLETVSRRQFRLPESLRSLGARVGTMSKPDWDEIDIFHAYLDHTLRLRRDSSTDCRTEAAS